jgi:Kef-type K+ transport system membrane component KefB
MKEKIKKIIKDILKFIIFWAIVIIAVSAGISKDFDINFIIRLIGIIAIIYFTGKFIYPEKYKKVNDFF